MTPAWEKQFAMGTYLATRLSVVEVFHNNQFVIWSHHDARVGGLACINIRYDQF